MLASAPASQRQSHRQSQRLPIVQAVSTRRPRSETVSPYDQNQNLHCTRRYSDSFRGLRAWVASFLPSCDRCCASFWGLLFELSSYGPLAIRVVSALPDPPNWTAGGTLASIALIFIMAAVLVVAQLPITVPALVVLVLSYLPQVVFLPFFICGDVLCCSCGVRPMTEEERQEGERTTAIEMQSIIATAFQAVQHRQLTRVMELIETGGVNPNATDPEGRTLLWIAVYIKDEACVTYLLAQGANSPLLETATAACLNGWLPALKQLIAKHRLNVNTIFEGGMGLLRIALRSGRMNLVEFLLTTPVSVREELTEVAFHAIVRQQTHILMQCVARGLDVNAQGADGSSLLHLAAFKGNTAAVNYLRAKGAVTDVKNRAGQTPAQVAILGGHPHIATMLGGTAAEDEEPPARTFVLRQPTKEELGELEEIRKPTRENLGELEKVQQELNNLEIEQQCVVCCDAPRSVVLIPCKHLAVCADCSKLLKDCPVCRTKIQTAIEIFVP